MKKKILSASALSFIVALVFVFNCKFSFADNEKPEEGSIRFGKENKPQIETSAQFQNFKNVFADAAEKVIPSVVSITTTRVDTVVYTNPLDQFFFDSPFGNPRQRREVPQRKQERRTSGVGSGVIVSEEGYILTNSHVVNEADEIVVELSDEREFDAEIVGLDTLSDVAVIKITEKVKDLPVVYIGDSEKLRPGDWVMAVGNPFNLSSTVTTGIVSGLGRQTGGIAMYQNFIQTDAAINPGNSGGGLVNIEGELVGINTMIFSRSGGYMGIGFAIPINMAKSIMEQLIYEREVKRGWLGVQISDIDRNTKEAMGLKSKKGVLINDVFENQPAEKAGIKPGDVVISIDNIKTDNANELKNVVASIKPGKEVPVTIIRHGKKKKFELVFANRDEKVDDIKNGDGGSDPEAETSEDIYKKLGFKVKNVTTEIREKMKLDKNVTGVFVSQINPASWVARKGLKKYDIIKSVKISGSPNLNIKSVSDFNSALSKAESGDSVLFYLQRGKTSFFLSLKIR